VDISHFFKRSTFIQSDYTLKEKYKSDKYIFNETSRKLYKGDKGDIKIDYF